VGVNKYRLEKEDPLHILDVDNEMVRKQQIEQLNELKQLEILKKLPNSLKKLTLCAQNSRRQFARISS
jgi:methylmalonyl-CoA mutase